MSTHKDRSSTPNSQAEEVKNEEEQPAANDEQVKSEQPEDPKQEEQQAEEEAKRKAEEEAKRKAEEEAKRKAEEEAKRNDEIDARNAQNQERAEKLFRMAQEAKDEKTFLNAAALLYKVQGFEADLRDIYKGVKSGEIANARALSFYTGALLKTELETQEQTAPETDKTENESTEQQSTQGESTNAPAREAAPVTEEEKQEMKNRITDWLSEENLKWAEGKTREEIFEKFGNELQPIAVMPDKYLKYLGDNLTDHHVYSGMGYFIDHALNHHKEEPIKEYLRGSLKLPWNSSPSQR